MISVDFIENNTVLKLDALKGRVDDATKTGIMRSQIHVQRKITENLRSGKFNIKTRKGGLASSIATAPVIKIGNDLIGIVGSNLKYARIQEIGGTTKLHKITARRGKALKFQMNFMMGEGKQGFTFLRSVNHPGSVIPAHFYMRKTLQEESNYIFNIINQAQGEAINVKA